MNTFTFGALTFTVTDGGIVALTKYYGFDNTERLNNPRALAFMELDVAGGTSSGSYRMGSSLETAKLRYVRHDIKENVLTIVQKSDSFEVTSCFTRYDDTNAIRVKHLIKNISDEKVCLEAATSLRLRFGNKLEEDKNAYFFHKFNNSRYTEAHPDVRSLNDLGFQWENGTFFVSNVGNASAYLSLPCSKYLGIK